YQGFAALTGAPVAIVAAMTLTPPQKSRILRADTCAPPDYSQIIWASGVNGIAPPASGSEALAEPARDARHRFAHLVGRARVGEAHEGPAVDRIEVDTRRCRDMGLFQHAACEFKTVRREVGNIGIEIERAVG